MEDDGAIRKVEAVIGDDKVDLKGEEGEEDDSVEGEVSDEELGLATRQYAHDVDDHIKVKEHHDVPVCAEGSDDKDKQQKVDDGKDAQ